ncbi:MAG TPA: PilZ domain-containing protein [Steroidobacteraceae bacterium]|nr:PilZ domain-containing protein [Steroidobacteraceae bacterium]
MEHRWGERVSVRTTVELSCGSLPPVCGYLENLSSSGALVRTDGPRPPRGPVSVIMREGDFGRRRPARVAAYVVRETANGVGIEWCEFAPRAVRGLLGSNTAMQPRVQSAASNATPSAVLVRAAG